MDSDEDETRPTAGREAVALIAAAQAWLTKAFNEETDSEARAVIRMERERLIALRTALRLRLGWE